MNNESDVKMLRMYQHDIWGKITEKKNLIRKLINEVLDLQKQDKTLTKTIEKLNH